MPVFFVLGCLRTGNSFRQASRMDGMLVRTAQQDDAEAIARIYIESWHDTYAAVLPQALLCRMTRKGQTARWRATIAARGREQVLVATVPRQGPVGLISFGAAQDRALNLDGEVYTLYIAPDHFGKGAGRALLTAAFQAMAQAKYSSCLIWAHAQNPARFFYEAMGGRQVAERTRPLMGQIVRETAFGWSALEALGKATAARRDVSGG